ncbi:MAG TPA: hypothetical protein VJY35_05740 [Candidatus Eisenbacteria bacterium]|nr:hypothetical protein [Candidatus Eisenbacteria bacterium]
MTPKTKLVARIDELLALVVPERGMNADDAGNRVMEMYQGALHLLRMIYGLKSPQEASLVEAFNSLRDVRHGAALQITLQPAAVGTLKAIRGEIQGDLMGSIAQRGAGEALADFVILAKDALATGKEASKNIAAVLTAALYEDTIRRLAASKAGLTGRPDLQEVVGALKTAGVFQGASTTIALGYLRFRNDALHADWAGITPAAIESCLGFVQGLLAEHFS